MKTPDEIKEALEICSNSGIWDCDACPYGDSDDCWECRSDLYEDAAAYIQQLENQLAYAGKKVEQLEAAQPKWISVEERLPEPHTDVLLIAHGWKSRLVYIGKLQGLNRKNHGLQGL